MESSFKILIIDDKKLDRDGICFLIKQHNLPLEPTTAGSGKEALEILANKHFDILFSDIKMPDMTGLDVIKQAKVLKPNLKCVVFSSYDNFQYAQTAINIGVSKYLLKPIDVKEFVDCCNKLIKEVSVERAEKNTNAFYDILYGDELADDLLSVTSGYLFMLDFIHPFFNRRNAESSLPVIPDDFITVPLNEYQCLFVAPIAQSAHNYISNLCNHFHSSDNLFLITCGGRFETSEELQQIFRDIENYTSAKFYLTKNEVAHLDDKRTSADSAQTRLLWETCSKIGRYANRRETDTATNLWLEIVAKLQATRSYPISVIKSACAEIVRECLLFDDERQADFSDFLEKIEQSNNIEELSNIVSDVIHIHASKSKEAIAIQNAIQLIHQNYMEDIGLESVAAQVYLSPCYFSYLFKKTTGINFLKYLTNYRVERAKDLLRSTQLRISEICERVGYSNRSYFCQIFRNYCGMSPNQYRETIE